ncbi:hypothetical protein VNO80_07305 [Phaseolus coccineus]|uniref:Uncharacterized protein n=1 Tax=Phaseolus coccineus TaxID=3886 RepID=A0AAN9NJW6_PHACN
MWLRLMKCCIKRHGKCAKNDSDMRFGILSDVGRVELQVWLQICVYSLGGNIQGGDFSSLWWLGAISRCRQLFNAVRGLQRHYKTKKHSFALGGIAFALLDSLKVPTVLDMDLIEPQNNLSFNDNRVRGAIIPIGPRFQAEVPRWEETTKIRIHENDDDLKFLGIQLWPIPKASENMEKVIGECRYDS